MRRPEKSLGFFSFFYFFYSTKIKLKGPVFVEDPVICDNCCLLSFYIILIFYLIEKSLK